MIQLTDKFWAVEVPDDANKIEICNYGLNDTLEYTHHIDGITAYNVDNLPLGTWQYLFTTKAATEEQSANIVQLISSGRISGRPQYRRYDRDLMKDTPAKCWTRDPRHSLETLIISKGLDVNKNYAILKLNDNGLQ